MTEGQNTSIIQVRIKCRAKEDRICLIVCSASLMGTQMYSPKTPKGKYDMVGTISYKLVILVELDGLERKRATVNVI